ncbi:hypothetical protein RHMOL_Rhmol03G0143800 [Rhododendron molle]|uniref:Uncharacterized protein n=1 Tax=Rhododendron molle TaxID=49168 RepID=A0ACC0PFF5_RHOML|nr:hypothetical protein RHMOL_Rhmol03G0143800 [Rhododendron molle]
MRGSHGGATSDDMLAINCPRQPVNTSVAVHSEHNGSTGLGQFVPAGSEREDGRLKVNASSAFMVEAIVVLKALEWARCKGWKRVEILTDCLQLISNLSHFNGVDMHAKDVLLDILYLSRVFPFVSIITSFDYDAPE